MKALDSPTSKLAAVFITMSSKRRGTSTRSLINQRVTAIQGGVIEFGEAVASVLRALRIHEILSIDLGDESWSCQEVQESMVCRWSALCIILGHWQASRIFYHSRELVYLQTRWERMLKVFVIPRLMAYSCV